MKKIIVTLVVVFSFSFCKAQWVPIPDANFATWLISNYPSCMKSGNQMDTTCNAIITATSVDCSGQKGISDLTGIQYFDKITGLYCNYNSLTNIPRLPVSLTRLDCYNNTLASLPSLPASLTSLDCSHNNLTSLPQLPPNIKYLNCSSNQLTSLPALPYTLYDFSCTSNQLTSLPQLPLLLHWFLCADNQLTSLPPLPSLLLSIMDCGGNKLTSLPDLPNSLNMLQCKENQLTSLPALPNSLGSLVCYDNPDLGCLPWLPKDLHELTCHTTAIQCLPNIPNSSLSSSLPICSSLFNPNGCIYPCHSYFTLYPDTVTPHHWFALNQATGKSPINYDWSWGDGSSNSTGATPSHTYSAAGYYKICLTITDDTTCTSTYCDSSTYLNRMEEENTIVTIDVVSSIPTAVTSVTKENPLILSPNPCTTCEIRRVNDANALIVTDLLGKTLNATFTKTSQGFILNLPNIPAGIYFVKNIKTGEAGKFVKE